MWKEEGDQASLPLLLLRLLLLLPHWSSTVIDEEREEEGGVQLALGTPQWTIDAVAVVADGSSRIVSAATVAPVVVGGRGSEGEGGLSPGRCYYCCCCCC